MHQRTLNRLTRFIDQFKQMNFANDAEMETQLNQVRHELLTRTAAEYRDNHSAQRSLRDGLSALAGKARELAQADARELVQQFGQLGRRRFHLAACRAGRPLRSADVRLLLGRRTSPDALRDRATGCTVPAGKPARAAMFAAASTLALS